MPNLKQQEWASQLMNDADAVVLDVRTQEEVDEGKIPGALHIDIYKGQGFIDEVKQLNPSKAYYVYCKAGARSAQACAIMNQLGFETTYNLLGGFSQWTGAIEY
ncbi:MAG: rhodanese-like domain-containing protein [Gelidibacter sp.]